MRIPSAQKPMFRRSALLPWVVFIVMAGLSVAAWWLTGREIRRTSQARFERLTERVQNALLRRFDTAAVLLQGAAAFPAASERVSAPDWSVYLRGVSGQLGDGVIGLGYAERVARTEIDQLETRMHADGETSFKAQRDGERPYLYTVLGIEPREHNTNVLGLDIGSGVTRREAAEKAAQENQLSLSRRIRVNYDNKEVPGFLLFLPVYKKQADISSKSQRLAAVEGWVYASIRIDELMIGVAESAAQQIDFDVFEGDVTKVENLLYDGDGRVKGAPDRLITEKDYPDRALKAVQSVDLYGRHWTLVLSTRPEFDQASFSSLPLLVLGVGLVFSVLAALLTWALVNSRIQALKLARDMTVDLRRLALVASHTGSGVILTDPEWRVEWINQGFTRMFGFTLDEIKGRKPATFMTGPDSDPKALESMDAASRARQPFLGEVLNYTKYGKKVWIELEIQPVINAQGELEGFMGLQLDITERKRQAEQMREAMEAAERANKAKSQFLAMMSHEIRTPMNGVIGMTSLLLDTPLNPDQRESAEIIRQSGESLLTIINDILDFSKIESGRLDLENTEFSVTDCVEGAIDLLANAAAKKRIELLYEISADIPAMMVGDAVRLRQVLVNLLGNAVKFTQHGEVAAIVKVTGRKEGSVDLLFQVRDTGIGISAEGMERLFKAFSQVDASMTRKFGGTGLGLVISRRLVELMGGRISAESELGRGSVFSFTLCLPTVDDGAAVPPGAQGSLSDRRVLIVEANENARRLLVERSQGWGMKTTEADSSSAALERLRTSEPFDTIILDLDKPGADGRELAATIRALPGREKLPIILVSTERQGDNARVFNAVLMKPVKPTQLFDAFVEIFWPSRGAAATAPVKPAEAMPPEPEPTRVLIVGEKSDAQNLMLEQLGRLKCQTGASDRTDLANALKLHRYEVIFLDPQTTSAATEELAKKIRHDLPEDSEAWLVAIIGEGKLHDRDLFNSAGINDVLPRPFSEVQLTAAMERAKWRLPS